jgi:serine/threonine-protein kinase
MTAIFGLYGSNLPRSILRDPENVLSNLPCAESVKTVLRQAVDWNREARFSDAKAFCDALRSALSDSASVPAVTAPIELRRRAASSATDGGGTGGRPDDDETPKPGDGAERDDPYIGLTLNSRYKLEKLVGEGGMGTVYLAKHIVIGKQVAVKILRSDLARNRDNVNRFLREAKAASKIGNPHIVDIFDFGELDDGSSYFVMEYISAKNLADIIDAEKRLSVERVYNIGHQIAAGLGAAHACGIIHRDLKPDNIMIVNRHENGEFVKILDFGIAKVTTADDSKLTRAGIVFGTPHYMSPEQASGVELDHRSDIYSLGVVLYEMLSGQRPFNADNVMAILSKHCNEVPIPVRELAVHCSPRLEAVILRCLEKKPDDRFQSMSELAAELLRAQLDDASESVAPPPSSGKRAQPPGLYTAVKVLTIMLVVIVVAIVLQLRSAASVAPERPLNAVMPVIFEHPPVVVLPPTEAPPPPEPPPQGIEAPQPPQQDPKVVRVSLDAMSSSLGGTVKAVAIIRGKVNTKIELPAIIDVPKGKHVNVTVRAPGHNSELVILNGSKMSVSVTLKPIKPIDALPPPPTTTAPEPDPPPPSYE